MPLKKKHYFLFVAIVLIAVLSYVLIQQDIDNTIYYSAGWILVVLALLIVGNKVLTNLFDKHFPWLKFGSIRLFAHLFIGILFSLVIINVAYLTFKHLLTNDPPTDEQLIVMNVYGVVIFVPLFSIYFSLQFLRHWRTSELETERFRKEHIRSQLESLKNHLDPHFLFNNLNILSSLIDKDKELSKTFLEKFAEFYRTILKSKDEDLITVDEELHFIDSYLFLIQTRFENIELQININKDYLYYMMPPLTLQMLIENALKHNVISEKKPLKITVENTKGAFLKITNSLNEKPDSLKDSNRSGLKNIQDRYNYFIDGKVVVEKTTDEFIVTIPLIEVETV